MWVDVGLAGAAVLLTLALGFSVCSLRKRVTSGCPSYASCPLVVTAALWTVLGVLLFLNRSAVGVPAAFVFLVYFVGGVGEVASVMVLRERSTDAIVAFGLRAGIVAIPLVLVLFAGFNF